MSISVKSGTIPYYGIFKNKAILLNGMNSYLNTDVNKGSTFHYIFPWEINFGGRQYCAVFEEYYLYLYQKDPETQYSIHRFENSSGNKDLEKAYMAIQPYYKFDLINPIPRLGDNCQIYVYEHNEFVLIHVDFFVNGSCEIVVTKDGYIQYNSTSVSCYALNYRYYESGDYFSSLTEGCDSCKHKSICSSASSTATSCSKFGTTYTLVNSIEDESICENSKFLLTPPSSSSKAFVKSNSSYLDLANYLNVSEGEISVVSSNKTHRVPILTSKPNGLTSLSVRCNGVTKYLPLSEDTSSDEYSTYTPIRLNVDNAVKSPYIPRVKSYMRHSLYDLPWEQFSDDIKFYTYKSGSYYRYYSNALLYTLYERIKVREIRIFGKLEVLGTDSFSDIHLPNSSYPGTLMMINEDSTNLTSHWTPSNTNQSITFEAGYVGSNGKFGQYITVIKSGLSLNIKQFAFTPSCASTSNSYGGAWVSFEPEIIELVEYSTGNTFYYQL